MKAEDLIYAIRSLRRAMGRQRWSWDDIEAYLGGSLSFWADGDEIVEAFRGPAQMTEAQKVRGVTSRVVPRSDEA